MYILVIRSVLYKIKKEVSSHKLKISTKMHHPELLALVQSCIPTLDSKSHKGEAGRIGIVGGSLEYTGAPYFAGISALKVGADLVHIFCTSQAASVIKSYSPELIVHPLLDHQNSIKEITPWLDRLHAIVIGPGLGRDNSTFLTISSLIDVIKEKKIPLVIDADGLFLITENPMLIKNFTSPVILTPNKIEFERLDSKINFKKGVKQLGSYVTILRKGETDEVFSPAACVQWQSNVGGSNRRCGGQGDILAGSIAIFLHWILNNDISIDKVDKCLLASSLACYAGSTLVRRCNEKAFKVKARSMLTSDMLEFLHEAFTELYER